MCDVRRCSCQCIFCSFSLFKLNLFIWACVYLFALFDVFCCLALQKLSDLLIQENGYCWVEMEVCEWWMLQRAVQWDSTETLGGSVQWDLWRGQLHGYMCGITRGIRSCCQCLSIQRYHPGTGAMNSLMFASVASLVLCRQLLMLMLLSDESLKSVSWLS